MKVKKDQLTEGFIIRNLEKLKDCHANPSQ